MLPLRQEADRAFGLWAEVQFWAEAQYSPAAGGGQCFEAFQLWPNPVRNF